MEVCPWGCPCHPTAPAGQQLWLDPGVPPGQGQPWHRGEAGEQLGTPCPGRGHCRGCSLSVSLTFANRIPPNAKLFFEVELVDIE